MKGTKYAVRYRRQRDGRTDYKKRLELLKGRKDRLVIRRTNTQMIMQIVRYAPDGDKVIVTTQSKELAKLGWKHSYKSLPAAYLAGIITAKKAKQKKIDGAVLDIGRQTPLKGSRIYAALKGTIDGGLDVPANEKIFPSPERLSGKHIDDSIVKDFERIRSEIMK